MKDKDQQLVGRRTLLTGMSVATVAGLAASATATSAKAAQQPAEFQPARHSKDAWMGELKGDHRVFIDSSVTAGGANAIRYANNILTAHEEDYEGSASDYAMIVCFRHGSTPYGYNDAVWAKYGSFFSRDADPAPTTNPMNKATPSNGQNTLASLREKGVQFAVCNRATRTMARRLASATGASVEEVYAELSAGIIQGGRLVAAGVIAATRSQEYGYSLLYSA